MFSVGAHYGFSKRRRHPSVSPYVLGVKNKTEIFDLEKTNVLLEDAKEYVKTLASQGKTILFVGSKYEAREAVKEGAERIDMPYVIERWIGGTLTNFPEIKKRIQKLLDLHEQKEKGELGKYTKHERLMIDRDVERLERRYGGLKTLQAPPNAIFIVDPHREYIAVDEALQLDIPIIALASTDCDISRTQYPVVGNDASIASISFFIEEIVNTYKENKVAVPKKEETTEQEK